MRIPLPKNSSSGREFAVEQEVLLVFYQRVECWHDKADDIAFVTLNIKPERLASLVTHGGDMSSEPLIDVRDSARAPWAADVAPYNPYLITEGN